MMIETSVSDVSVFRVLGEGTVAVEHMTRQVSVEKLEDIRDRMEEQNAEVEERREFFIEAGKAGVNEEEDLLNELNELEAEMAGKELEQLELPSIRLE